MVSLKDHGTWHRYTPDQLPEGVPPNVMFARRDSDGIDWYAYNHNPGSFESATVKCVLLVFREGGPWEVGQANRDQTCIFPPDGSMVVEILDDTGTDDPSRYLKRILQNGDLVEPTPETPEEPHPFASPPVTVAAAFNIMIENGDITGIQGSFNIIGSIYLDVGLYVLIFTNALPDVNYYALITGDAPSSRMIDAMPDSFVIECKDAPDGSGIDPASLSVQIMRVDQ